MTNAIWCWEFDAGSRNWDENLSLLGGHPLQSALWGDARRSVDGISDFRWQVRRAGEIIWMARCEVRRIPMIGLVAWIPRGPVSICCSEIVDIEAAFRARLRDAGIVLMVTDRWLPAHGVWPVGAPGGTPQRSHTIWVDLSRGSAELWKSLDKQWRYGVGKARREGVECEQTHQEQDIAWFFSLCENTSRSKGFKLPGSLEVVAQLLRSNHCRSVSAHLFVARVRGVIGAGAYILRCGSSVHYFWGASDRQYSQFRVGEAVQWAVIEWAIEQGCDLYDLERIDPVKNFGVYQFKKKMGGVEVTLEGMNFQPLNWRGALLNRCRRVLHG